MCCVIPDTLEQKENNNKPFCGMNFTGKNSRPKCRYLDAKTIVIYLKFPLKSSINKYVMDNIHSYFLAFMEKDVTQLY